VKNRFRKFGSDKLTCDTVTEYCTSLKVITQTITWRSVYILL